MGGAGATVAGAAPHWETLERELELQAIGEALLRAAEGTGSAAIVEGPIGIGKSRILGEAGALAERRRFDVLSARGGELERDYPFGVVLQLFEQRVVGASDDERERLIRGRARAAEALMFGTPSESGPASAADEFAVLHALYWLVVNLAEERPLALVVDDLHWVDDLSLRFLIYLTERLGDLPIALLGAARNPRSRVGDDLVTRLLDTSGLPSLRPAELSVEATQRLLGDAGVQWASDEAAVEACWRVSGGSPLVLRELVIAMHEDQELLARPDLERIRAMAPRSLERRILPRITGMGPEALAVAQVASLLGEGTRLPSVARASGLPYDDAVAGAESLLDAAILSGVDPVEFSHPMMRTVVFASIPPGERLRLHAAAARELHAAQAPAEQVAHHLMAGSPLVQPWVAEALHAAARAAAQRGSPATAVEYLRQAIERVQDPGRRGSLLVDLGLLEASTGETTSLERFEAALSSLDEAEERARALYALGQTLYRYGRHDEAVETLRRGAELFASDRETALRFEAAATCAVTWVAGRHENVVPRLEELVGSIPADRPPTAAERALLAALATYRAGTQPPVSEQAVVLRRALEGGVLRSDTASGGVPLFLAILGLIVCGEADEAEYHASLALDDASRRDDALAFAEASMTRAFARYVHGRVGEAMADADAAIQGAAHGWRSAPQIAQAILVMCHMDRGELEEAGAVLDASHSDTSGGLIANTLLLAARARLRLLQGDPAGALEDAWATRDGMAPIEFTNPMVSVWRSLACAALDGLGDAVAARALIEEEIELATAYGLPARLGAALRVRASLDASAAGLADLQESVRLLTGAGAPLELARTQLELGVRLHAGGDEEEEARATLRSAMGLAHECGGHALESAARDALVAAGGRPRRAPTSGAGALTPSERRIAELAAAGTSNREIAESLFVTKNTVEWHLRNVFKKLGVASRAELRALLERSAAEQDQI